MPEIIFSQSLKNNLKKRVKGEIYVHNVDDTLIVSITSQSLPEFRYTMNNLYYNIQYGLSSRVVADTIISTYKRYIYNKFFIKKNWQKIPLVL